MSTAEAFFQRDGDDFIASELTRGPWSREHQHGGPPAALLARAIERRAAAERNDLQIARMLVLLLRPVPIGRCTVTTEVVRAGRKTQTLEASLSVDGREVARASALALRTTHLDLPERPAAQPPSLPEKGEPFELPFALDPIGYHKAMEIRVTDGSFGSGALRAWMRMRCPLVAGEEPSPLVRVLVAADSTNGLSTAIDPHRYTFLNADLTVYLHRMPVGEWVCLDAATIPERSGIGLAESALYDLRGPIGRAAEALLLEARAGGG